MIVRRPSRGRHGGRNVTPMRGAATLFGMNLQTHGSQRRRSARQLSKPKLYVCYKDSLRAARAGGGCLNGGSMASGCERAHGEGVTSVSGSQDFSQDNTSMTMPSGVSSFLLDCLDADSPSSDTDLTLSSIEEFRKADSYDGSTAAPGDHRAMTTVKNSTLLDVSHAQDLALHQPPNLSSILEPSLDPDEKKAEAFSLFPVSVSPVRVSCEASASADERTPATAGAVLLSPAVTKCFSENKKAIKCRKVTFSDIVSIRNVSGRKRDRAERREVSGNTPAEPTDIPDIPTAPARFFQFADESERRAFFHRLKQTCSFMFPAKPPFM